jgi:hypothetical protein
MADRLPLQQRNKKTTPYRPCVLSDMILCDILREALQKVCKNNSRSRRMGIKIVSLHGCFIQLQFNHSRRQGNWQRNHSR